MKIAIPTNNNMVEDHFGHCDSYTIFDVDQNNNIMSKEVIKWLHGCGCKSNLAETLKEMNVTTLLLGNIGQRALHLLKSSQIDVIRGCHGTTELVLQNYLDGKLTDVDTTCHHHDCQK